MYWPAARVYIEYLTYALATLHTYHDHSAVAPNPLLAGRRALRIAILTTGRFYVCELARELDARGHQVRLYSAVPPWRLRKFGIPDRCTRWLGPYIAPLMLASRAPLGPRMMELCNMMTAESIDAICARVIEPCDVFIGLATMSRKTIQAARRKYGALTFVERANRHVLSQEAILQEASARVAGAASRPRLRRSVDRELAEYQLADVVSVPAGHVIDSFEEYGFKRSRLFCNPFGVELEMFPPTPAPDREPRRLLMAGTWGVRKGADVLLEAWRRLKARPEFVHVGSVLDLPLPTEPGFKHYAPVDITRLVDFYASAHLFVLPSREEGMALVQLQALACGLPIVCTSRTGGADLRSFVRSPDSVRVVQPDDPEALASAIEQALVEVPTPGTMRDLLGSRRPDLSWAAYARRYEAKIYDLLAERGQLPE